MSIFARLYILLHAQARLVIAGAVLLVLGCSFFAAMLLVREDITTLIPQKPEGLAAQFALLRGAPLLQGLTIAVGGPDPASSAKLLAEKLRSPEIRIVAGVENSASPSFLTEFCAAVPGLMDREAVAKLPDFIGEAAVRDALQRNIRLMRSAQGIALRDLVTMDPLGICAETMKVLMPKNQGNGLRFDKGILLSADGRYALVLAEPAASMADSEAARAVMAKVREAIRALPENTEILVTGGHRHTEENADVIQADMQRVLPLSLTLLILTYLVFVRTWKGLSIVLLPSASLAVAATCTAFVYGGLSGIVLGFGSVVLGIAADYAIHVYYAMRSGEDAPDALTRLTTPMLFGTATTLAGFLAFFSSSIPCIVQMAIFASVGVVTAVLLSLVVLPHIVVFEKPSPPREALRPTDMRVRHLPLLCLWGVIGSAIFFLLWNVPVNGDIRTLSYASDSIKQVETQLRESFGTFRDRGMFAVNGATIQEALARNDAVWEALRENASQSGWDISLLTSLAPVMPSEETQHSRHRVWEHFWTAHADATMQRLEAASAAVGFKPEAFSPFREWITAPLPLVTPELLRQGGLDLMAMLAHENQTSALVYSLVQGNTLPAPAQDILQRHGAWFVSGVTFREAMDAATRSELLRFGSISLLAILVFSSVLFRSPVRMGMTLLPAGAAMCAVLTVFKLADMSLNIFHAIALPLVICLSVDYGIFILANLEGRLHRESRMGVFLSGLTTLFGFSVLLLAKHPALHSFGLSVSVGLIAAMLTALVALPHLTRPDLARPFAGNEGTL
ncbi:MAG: MMPL family transporter [Desulfovibrionaceae bacterium]|nr:MMPL family transporter [Desulfovibrionaceae bacterium]